MDGRTDRLIPVLRVYENNTRRTVAGVRDTKLLEFDSNLQKKKPKFKERQFLNQRQLTLQTHVLHNGIIIAMFVQILKNIAAKLLEEFGTQNYLKLIQIYKKKKGGGLVQWEIILAPGEADTSKSRVAKFHYVTNICINFQNSRKKTVGEVRQTKLVVFCTQTGTRIHGRS